MTNSATSSVQNLDRDILPTTQVADSFRANVGTTENREYRPAIDGLRAIAVLAVITFHLRREWLPGGFVGVDIFFVISGYLITSILLRNLDRGSLGLGPFYQRRIARLLPTFATVAIVTLIAAFFVYSNQDLASAGATAAAAALSIANLKFMLQGSYFILSPDAQPFLHCWSLSVEEQFYLVFPALLFLIFATTKKYRSVILICLWGISLLACIILTADRPQWAFFLLPTRAWELLTGAILTSTGNIAQLSRAGRSWFPIFGFIAIVISIFAIHEGSQFPGWIALLPVFGAMCIIVPSGASGAAVERFLSLGPIVAVGRMSYSLYLWHWPVFSLVDYSLYLSSAPLRIFLKLSITAIATVICYSLIEKPSRSFLNRSENRGLTFAVLAGFLCVIVPAGTLLNKKNYVNAEIGDVRAGGLVFNDSARQGSIVLMGDSNGSMYGKVTKDIASKLHMKLNVVSVASGDPLPQSPEQSAELWLNSLAVVKKERPSVLILACKWVSRLRNGPTRLASALRELKPFTQSIILMTQPPELPSNATRESMRSGSRPPFFENAQERILREQSNELVKSQADDQVKVIDVETVYLKPNREITFFDGTGEQCYQDAGHFSYSGTKLLEPLIISAFPKNLIPQSL